LFSYRDCSIISAIPLWEIQAYLAELGAVAASELVYTYAGLEIEVSACASDVAQSLCIPRHSIHVRGDKALAEQFLTAFRFRFLSAGG